MYIYIYIKNRDGGVGPLAVHAEAHGVDADVDVMREDHPEAKLSKL